MIKPKTRRNIRRIAPYGLIWLLSGWVFLIVELAASNNFSQIPSTAIKIDAQIFILSSLAMACVGIITGLIEMKYLNYPFANKNFALRFLYKLFIYSLFFLLVILITFPIAASLELEASILDQKVWNKYIDYLRSITHLSTALQLATALILSLFYSEISEFIGQGVLTNFLTGKYHKAVEEERIFMFLDMKSSTTIAEQLGHQQYFKLLRAYYDCFTDAIIDHEGEIYQYVGDEIILSWKFQGNTSDNRCIDCFFAMKENLRKRKSWFKENFWLMPTFKAAIHYGKVTTGEIGSIKKEILFSGDILNATARLQGLCNSYNVDLIVSIDLTQQLQLPSQYATHYLGKAELRGKTKKMGLYNIVNKTKKPVVKAQAPNFQAPSMII